jgi:hypothetical protein
LTFETSPHPKRLALKLLLLEQSQKIRRQSFGHLDRAGILFDMDSSHIFDADTAATG